MKNLKMRSSWINLVAPKFRQVSISEEEKLRKTEEKTETETKDWWQCSGDRRDENNQFSFSISTWELSCPYLDI